MIHIRFYLPRERKVRPWPPFRVDLTGKHPRVHRGYRYRGWA
jgi:hypothetical protein